MHDPCRLPLKAQRASDEMAAAMARFDRTCRDADDAFRLLAVQLDQPEFTEAEALARHWPTGR